MNSPCQDTVEELVKDVIVEKHLRGQKVAAAVHLPFKVADVVLPVRTLDVALRITGRADAEAAVFPDLSNQLVGVAVLAGGGERGILRDIPAQGKDIFNMIFS